MDGRPAETLALIDSWINGVATMTVPGAVPLGETVVTVDGPVSNRPDRAGTEIAGTVIVTKMSGGVIVVVVVPTDEVLGPPLGLGADVVPAALDEGPPDDAGDDPVFPAVVVGEAPLFPAEEGWRRGAAIPRCRR